MSADSTEARDNEHSATSSPNDSPANQPIPTPSNEGDEGGRPDSLIVENEQADIPKSETAKHFNEMMSRLGDDYFDRVTKLAEQNTYSIGFKIPTGKTIKDPITDEDILEYSGWENKTYRRGRITAEEYKKIEILRGKYNKERDQEKNAELFAKLYQYIAYVYLGMKYEDIRRADWDELKPVLDACNFGTVYSMKNKSAFLDTGKK
jgi:hypothetical protein